MSRLVVLSMFASLVLASAHPALGTSWIIENYTLQDGPFYQVVGGGYNGANYHYSEYWGIQRAFWHFDFPDVPGKPALYYVEQYVPTVMPEGVTSWNWMPIEVTYLPGGGTNEEAKRTVDIPWKGAYGTNHQWIGMDLHNPPGTFEQAGPGPQAPANDTCAASGSSPQSLQMWMRRGSTLYMKWDFTMGTMRHAVTALRITEVFPPVVSCAPATYGGPVDLRCLGNVDPLYGSGEFFARAQETTIDGDQALAVDQYLKGSCWALGDPQVPDYKCPDFCPVVPGLPVDGVYTAHVPGGDVTFQLRYEDMHSIAWRSGVTEGPLRGDKVYILNEVAGQEFVAGLYGTLHFLSTFSGNGGRLRVEAVYTDSSSDIVEVNLYDWFNQDGDAGSWAVGLDGNRRLDGGIGFQRLDPYGKPIVSDGTEAGAFLFAHAIAVNPAKALNQVKLSITGDTDGRLTLLAATFGLAPPPDCNTPVFDAAGGGPQTNWADGSVDQEDFGVFQVCVTGPDPAPGVFDPDQCHCFDVDGDDDVDADDYAYFEACATSPASSTPPPAGCDQPPGP